MSSKLITATDVALRDRKPNLAAWIRWRAAGLQQQGRLSVIWDGRTVADGPVVAAQVNRSRWIAICPFCGNVEYVCPETPVFYCLRCANENSNAALPVVFPDEIERIEAALLARPVVAERGGNQIEIMLSARAMIPGLPRSWLPGVSAQTLEDENEEHLHV